jgi:cytochrome c oxidase cbb3-type subunit 3
VQPGTQPVRPKIGGFVPGQQRPPEDPAKVTRGKTLFEINCRGCHGADLRGGDLGGPNLLRSQVALSDQNGELIVPIIHGSREKMGMPAIGLNDEDARAVVAYVHTVLGTIGTQGKPPDEGRPAPNALVGNAAEGKAYFTVKCATCHSATGDLQGLANQFSDPKKLQNAWVAGGDPRRESKPGPDRKTVTVTIALPSGEKLEGPLVRIDDFLVAVQLPDGTQRTISRVDSHPEVTLHDPMQTHRELLSQLTDKDMHDVTAYLATLK